MSDVAKINGFNIKDNSARNDIAALKNGTQQAGLAKKLSNPLTIVVNGETTTFDGSVARTITIDTGGGGGGDITKEMSGKSSIQQITGLASNYSGTVTITNYSDVGGTAFHLSVNPDGTEYDVMTMYADGKTTVVLEINNGVVGIVTMSGPSISEETVDVAYNYGNPTISQTFIYSDYYGDSGFSITYKLGSL